MRLMKEQGFSALVTQQGVDKLVAHCKSTNYSFLYEKLVDIVQFHNPALVVPKFFAKQESNSSSRIILPMDAAKPEQMRGVQKFW